MSKSTKEMPRNFDEAPLYLTKAEWCHIRNSSLATCNRKLAAGQLKAVKDGFRTLIVTESAKAEAARLPEATFRSAA